MKLNQDWPLTVSINPRSALQARAMRENFSSCFKRCSTGAKPSYVCVERSKRCTTGGVFGANLCASCLKTIARLEAYAGSYFDRPATKGDLELPASA